MHTRLGLTVLARAGASANLADVISVIVPALNEGDCIVGTLAAARRAFGEQAEYLVIDGGSTDATVAHAHAAGAQVLICPPGRGCQLQLGATRARGEVLVFLHADTMLPADALTAITRALDQPDVVGGAFSVRFSRNRPLPRILSLIEQFLNLRSRLLHLATGDQAIFARRDVLERAGGVPQVPLFEDVRLHKALRRTGKVVVVSAAVETSPRLWLAYGPWRIILRHIVLRSLHTLGVSPDYLARHYRRTRLHPSR